MDNQLSKNINAIRFPLIILVVFIHMLPFEHQPLEYSISTKSFYILLSEIISHNVGRIAVPLFFVFSGYLFIYNKGETSSKDFFLRKWKKRFFTLLIPYLLWNSICLASNIARNVVLQIMLGASDNNINTFSLYELFWINPADFPLWYIRDLLCMTLLAPLFYYLLKLSRGWWLLVIACCYFLNYECGIPGFSTTAFFYYNCGFLLGMNQVDFSRYCLKYKNHLLVSSGIFLLICLLNNASPDHEYFVRLFCPLAMGSALALTASLKTVYINRLISLSSTSFFIYSVHEVHILGWLNGVYLRMLGTSDFAWLIRYLTEPFVIIVICLVLYKLGKSSFPKSLLLLTGNRC